MFAAAPAREGPVSFDEFFARLVRVTGWGLGVYAVLTGYLKGPEIVALILAFVGFEVVSRVKDRALAKHGTRDED